MSEYIFVLLWIGGIALLANSSESKCMTNVLGVQKPRTTWLWALLGFGTVIWIAGNRSIYFADTWAYVTTFREMPENLSEIGDYIQTLDKDIGFYIFSSFLKWIIGNHEQLYLFLIAVMQGTCLLAIYRRYSTSYFISIFLFVASTDYISWMFNGIRQFMAVTTIFAGTTLMLKQRYGWATFLILLASTFHGSAILMLPMVFIAQGKALNKKTLLITFVCLIALVFAEQFTDVLDFLLSDTQYKNVVSDYESWNDDGTNPIRVLVYAVPTLISLFGLRYIRHANDPVINFCTNMSFISTAAYLVSMVTSGTFIGRIPIYFSLYNYILLPWEIKHMLTKDSQKLAKILMVVFYLLFYTYQMRMNGLI